MFCIVYLVALSHTSHDHMIIDCAGKTVAGELAIYYALALGLRVFYTTPLKVCMQT